MAAIKTAAGSEGAELMLECLKDHDADGLRSFTAGAELNLQGRDGK